MTSAAGKARAGFGGAAGAAATGAAGVAAALLAEPPTAGFSGLLLAPLFVVVCLLLALHRRVDGDRDRPRLWPAVLVAAVATAIYWWWVWSYRDYGMGGIPLDLLYGVGFWWPGLPIALGARLGDRGLGPMRSGDFFLLVLAGILGAGLGTGAYEKADELYYASRDRLPLEEGLRRVEGSGAAVSSGASVEIDHARRTLTLDLALPGPAERPAESSYGLLEPLHGYLAEVRSLLGRHDTDSLRVRVDRGGRRLATLNMGASDTARSLAGLLELDRSALPNGGQLGLADVEEMVERALFSYDRLETGDGLPGFRTEVGDGVLSLTYRPPEPTAAVEARAAAWTAANRAVDAILRFFPDVERVRLRYPELDTVYSTSRTGTKPDLPLQAALLPRGRVPVLEVRSTERAPGVPDTLRSAEGFRADRFCPDERVAVGKIVVVRANAFLTDHLLADLFEPSIIGTGELFVAEIAEDGTATVHVRRWQEEARGPRAVAPGETAVLAGEEIYNGGLVDRREITCHGRPVIGSRRDRREP